MSYRFADSKLSAKLYDMYHCSVCTVKTPDDGQRNCPKHVEEFHFKNEFEKLVHQFGFIIEFYHDARSYKRQILAY
jgi:lysyl-tRNA synthetase class I